MVQSAHSGSTAGALRVKPFKSCQLVPNDALLTLHICLRLRLICTITELWRHNYHHFVYLIKSNLNNESREPETLILNSLKVQFVTQSVYFEATKKIESSGDEL